MPVSEPDTATQKAQEAWCLGSALMEQHILHLHFEHEMPHEDISRRVGMSVEVVTTTCTRYEEKTLAID